MPPLVIDIRSAEDARDVVHRAVQALAEGQLVAFPTETVYGLAASALSAEGVQRLLNTKGRPEGQPVSLAIKSAQEALDYVPNMSPLAQRLARRCWPGPITLVVDATHPDSLIQRLPKTVQQALCPQGKLGLRVPFHSFVLDALKMMAGPILLSSANRSGMPDAITGQDVVESLGDEVHLVLDDGRSRFGQPSSVVEVHNNQLRVLRAGVISEQNLKRLASFIVVFVCTGNTCRSPMAEAICRKLLSERLGCTIEELEDRGVVVRSAGTSAMIGGRAANEAIATVADLGVDLSNHESQPLTEQLVKQADLIWTMTHSHRQAVLSQWPDVASRTALLSRDEIDLADPIGGPAELYERCAQRIRAELEARIPDWDLQNLS